MAEQTFREQLETAINTHSRENGSNTPDFILAEYLAACLAAFDATVNAREKWYGREPQLIGSSAPTSVES